jgi:hypothetical protein
MTAVFLYLRLALATGIVLAPGWLVARSLGLRGVSGAVAWALAAVFAAMAVTFAVGASSTLTLALLLAVGVVAFPFARANRRERIPGWGWVAAAGVALGILLWHVAGNVDGDGLFHLARVRKLLELDDLTLAAVEEFPDGGPHPGYAFPLWHGFVALVAKVAAADPGQVVLHLPSILAVVAVLAWYEAGHALFRAVVPAAATAGAAVGLYAMAPGSGGSYVLLGLPETATRHVLVPAALALAFGLLRRPGWQQALSLAAAAFAIAVAHGTYLVFLAIPFAGFLLVRVLWTREDVRGGVLALAALLAAPAAFFVWLLPVVRETASVSPDAAERSRSLAQYAGQIVVYSENVFRLSAAIFGRTGAVSVAALMLVPLAALAARRRWAAFVVGGTLAVFAVTLIPPLFSAFSDLVSLSQSRRLAGFVPLAVSFAGGMGVVVALLGGLAAPLALVAGLFLQVFYAGDFEYRLTDGGPTWATLIALVGGLAALAWGFLQRPSREAVAALASALFLLPVFVHGFIEWSADPIRKPSPLTPGLVRALGEIPAGDTVFSDAFTSYRIGAAVPVYVCSNPVAHVADTAANRPYGRRREAEEFVRTGDLSIPRSCGAQWIVLDRGRSDLELGLERVYADDRYVLYGLSPSS